MLDESKNNETNFWISYADLMAGLLFVFILLIGAIAIKSMVLKENLSSKANSLENSLSALSLKNIEMQKLKDLLAKRIEDTKKANDNLQITKDMLKLKTEEINNLNNMLISANMEVDNFNAKIIILQNLLKKDDEKLKDKNKAIDDYKNKIIVLSDVLTKKDNAIKLNDKKLLELLRALDEKKTKYDELVLKLKNQKSKIKSLTGIKIKVIAELKKSLGDKIEIDSGSGSLRLSSNILFDKGSSTLKDSAKKELKKVFVQYIGTLILNKKIVKNIDRIIIEGHTDSDGKYMYNLHLSQQRAYAVMNYLSTLEFTKKHNIKPLMVASGRSYLDIIKKKNKEDKLLSRRIEIKFSLKNDSAMSQIDAILDYE